MIRNNCFGFRFFDKLAGTIRLVQTASLVTALACVLILVGACLGSSDPAKASQVAIHIEGLSVVVQPRDGTYEIQTGNSGHSVIHARVAAEIDHKRLRSTDYPHHEISQSTFEDALGHGNKITITSSGLPHSPDLAYSLQLYEGRGFGVIEVEVQNHTSNPTTIQSIRSVEAIGTKIVDLGGVQKSDRVLSDSYSEDWPPLQSFDLGKLRTECTVPWAANLLTTGIARRACLWVL